MQLLVGLGNPGDEYSNTKHNIGFIILDRISSEFKINKKLFGHLADFKHQEEKIILQKPTTFMNQSGKAVLAAQKYYKVPLEKILIIHDDTDLEIGCFKYATKSGSGGHNGIISIIKTLGTEEFARLKIGVRSPSSKQKAGSLVLQKFKKSETVKLDKIFPVIKESIDCFLENGIEQTMNKYNKYSKGI